MISTAQKHFSIKLSFVNVTLLVHNYEFAEAYTTISINRLPTYVCQCISLKKLPFFRQENREYMTIPYALNFIKFKSSMSSSIFKRMNKYVRRRVYSPVEQMRLFVEIVNGFWPKVVITTRLLLLMNIQECDSRLRKKSILNRSFLSNMSSLCLQEYTTLRRHLFNLFKF